MVMPNSASTCRMPSRTSGANCTDVEIFFAIVPHCALPARRVGCPRYAAARAGYIVPLAMCSCCGSSSLRSTDQCPVPPAKVLPLAISLASLRIFDRLLPVKLPYVLLFADHLATYLSMIFLLRRGSRFAGSLSALCPTPLIYHHFRHLSILLCKINNYYLRQSSISRARASILDVIGPP